MDPTYWGPAGWKVLHRMAYSIHTKTDAQAFFASLQYLLPCVKCQGNFRQHVEALPFPRSTSGIGRWIYNVHNRVNKSNGVSDDMVPCYESIYQMYHGRKAADPEEWVFIDAIVRMHPGKWDVSASYLEQLRVFLEKWCDASKVPLPDDLSSKVKLRTWIKSHEDGAIQAYRKKKLRKCKDVCQL